MTHAKTQRQDSFLLSILVALAMIVGLLAPKTAFAAPRAVTPDSTGSITISSGLGEGDEVKAYRAVEVTYDATNNTVSYALADGLSFDGKTGEEGAAAYMALTEADAIKAAAESLLAQAKANGLAPEGTAEVAAGATSATIGNLPMGQYLIEVTPAEGSADKVYQVTTANLAPTVTDGTYMLDDVTIDEVKSSDIDIPKSIGEIGATTADGYQNGDEIPFFVQPTVPQYPTSTEDTEVINKTFIVSDTMTSGLDFSDEQLAAIEIADPSGNALPAGSYEIERAGNGFRITFDYDQVSQFAGQKLTISYSATLNSTNETGIEENTATLTYARDPFDGGTYDTSSKVTDYSFGFFLVKKGESENGPALEGATFEVRDAAGNLMGTITTDANGYAGLAGLKNEGVYTLHETVVPSGYQAVADFTVTISRDAANLDFPVTADITETNLSLIHI